MNKVQLRGYAGEDAKVRDTNTGKKVANFSLATSRKFKDGKEQTVWHRIVAWEYAADESSMIKKGDYVLVEGSIAPPREYKASDGTTKMSYEINAEFVGVFNSRKKAMGAGTPKDVDQQPPPVNVNDIPF